MTGYECVCEAIERFERSLEDGGAPVRSVAEFAKLAGYSVYHFTRLFAALTATNPKDYISGRILSETAREIASSNEPIHAIARRRGFDDYESFSRAFKRRFGIPPKRVRDLRHVPFACTARAVPKLHPGTLNLTSAEPEITTLDSFCLTGLSFYIDHSVRSFHRHWASFIRLHGRVAGAAVPETFWQYTSWSASGDADGMHVLCALQTRPGTPQEPVFSTREVPAARYLRFVHTAGPERLVDTYRYIYEHWLASHEVMPAGFWECQRYPDPSVIEILIPLAPRT